MAKVVIEFVEEDLLRSINCYFEFIIIIKIVYFRLIIMVI